MFRYLFAIAFTFFSIAINAQETSRPRDTVPYGGVLDENLLIAAYNGDYAKAALYIGKGANVNIKDYNGITPLLYAIRNKDLSITRLLVSKGADVNLKPTNYREPAPLIMAVKLGYTDIAQHLLNNKADVAITDYLGATALHYAALYNDSALTTMLLEKNAGVNDTTLLGETPIFAASFNNSTNVFEILLNNGADLEKSDQYGFTPLMVACQNGHYPIALRLLQNWVEVNRQNSNGFSALSFAIAGGYADIVDLLRLNGANVNEINNLSLNPRSIAKGFRYTAISDSLKASGAKPNFVPHFAGFYFQTDALFNNKDFLTGGGFGMRDVKYGVELSFRYYFRPKAKPVLIPNGENAYFQYWERRHRLGISLSKPFTLIKSKDAQTGIFIGSGLDVHFGYYRGTKEPINGGLIPSPFTGLFFKKRTFEMKFSAQYTNYNITGLSNWYAGIGIVFHSNGTPRIYTKKLKLVE